METSAGAGEVGRLNIRSAGRPTRSGASFPGRDSVFDGGGNLIGRRYDESPRDFSEYALNGEMKRGVGEGRLVLTGQVDYSSYQDDSTLSTTSPSGAPLENEATPYTEEQLTGEAGVTFERGFRILEHESRGAGDTQAV